MALGEACGIAAKTAADANAKVRAVDVPAVQKEILKRGGVILYEAHPWPARRTLILNICKPSTALSQKFWHSEWVSREYS